MQAQEKNTKGFNILELIVVIVIIGIISAAAYPKFSDWKKKREIRDTSLRIKSLMLAINAQVQRGLYSFVQVYMNVNETTSTINIVSKGMKQSTLASKINNGDDLWNTDPASRCDITGAAYWDDDGTTAGIMEVQSMTLDRDKYTTNFVGEAAVCFSKNAQWYSGAGVLVGGTGADAIVEDRIFICLRDEAIDTCAVNEDTGEPTVIVDNLYSIDWTRFGDVTMEKWNKGLDEWVLQ